jgi:hypothetical protein
MVVLLGATAVAVCVPARPDATRGAQLDPMTRASACIRVEDLAEWEPIDNRTILLSVPGNRRGYLITLATPIEDLRLADAIDVIDSDLNGFICADGVDEVFAAECSCASASIASIEYLTEKRTAELLGEGPTIL